MATPLVAASALLVRQYFQEGFYPTGRRQSGVGFAPSGALVKAVLLNGAVGMEGFMLGSEGTSGTEGLPLAPVPSYQQGYGRLSLNGSLPLQVWIGSPTRPPFFSISAIMNYHTSRRRQPFRMS